MLHRNYNVLVSTSAFPRSRLYQALAFDGVRSVTPLYTGSARWKHLRTGRTRSIFVVGVDPSADVYSDPEIASKIRLVRFQDTVLYDASSRPEYGDIASLFRSRRTVETELNNRRVTIRGLFDMGASFGVDGTVLTSDLNYRRLFPQQPPGKVAIGLIQLEQGADPERVRGALARYLPQDVKILTRQEFFAFDVDYWDRATPIGFVFSFGVTMGLVVGMIIVYQILFADIADHMKQYATLKAIGYRHRYLATVVLTEATVLALAGFVPGALISSRLYEITRESTMLPMALVTGRVLEALGLTLVMCWGSALIAIRKLRAAQPADVF
jgi:putative ABC transport system permease protein